MSTRSESGRVTADGTGRNSFMRRPVYRSGRKRAARATRAQWRGGRRAQPALNQGLTLTCSDSAQYAGLCSRPRPLHITLNGEPYELDEPMSIADLLMRLSIDPRRVAVEHNLTILKRQLFADTVVQDGDRIEVVNFVGGG